MGLVSRSRRRYLAAAAATLLFTAACSLLAGADHPLRYDILIRTPDRPTAYSGVRMGERFFQGYSSTRHANVTAAIPERAVVEWQFIDDKDNQPHSVSLQFAAKSPSSSGQGTPWCLKSFVTIRRVLVSKFQLQSERAVRSITR
jgi:hypothetical protein